MDRLDDVVETFELLGDWESRYAYLSELGEQLPAIDEANKIEDNRVKACISMVWVKAYQRQKDQIHFQGECDTAITKGVLAVLIQLVEGKTAAEVAQLDIDLIFERLRLADHLSPNRHVGIYAIVDLMKKQVAAMIG